MIPWSHDPSPAHRPIRLAGAVSCSKTKPEALHKRRLLQVCICKNFFLCVCLFVSFYGFMLDLFLFFLGFFSSLLVCVAFVFTPPDSFPIPEGFHFSLSVSPRLPLCWSFRLSSLLCLRETKGEMEKKKKKEEEHRYETPSCVEGPWFILSWTWIT